MEKNHVKFETQPVVTISQVPIVVDELKQYHFMTVEDVAEELNVKDVGLGLSTAEVDERLKTYGQNVISVNKSRIPLWIRLLFRHSVNLMTFVLLFAAIISGAVQDWVDMGVILCIIVINIAIGFMQEFRSEKTLEKLRNMTAPMCKVIRDGEKQKVLSSALVPGDIVVLKEGDQVPADMRLFSSVNLECNEALLTGESLPVAKHTNALLRRSASKQLRSRPSILDLIDPNVANIEAVDVTTNVESIGSPTLHFPAIKEIESTTNFEEIDIAQKPVTPERRLSNDKVGKNLLKTTSGLVDPKALKTIPLGDRLNMAFMNTSIAKGKGSGIVVATGADTEIGKIAKSLKEAKEGSTPLQKRLNWLGIVLLVTAVFAFGATLLATYLYGKPIFPDAFLIGVSIAVAIIPESLVAVVTLTMSLSVRKMVKQKAIVRKLAALESLGNVSDICTDKTGTLTEGKMIVTMFWSDGKIYDVTQEGKADTINGVITHEKKAVDTLPKGADLIVTIASLCNSSSITLATDVTNQTVNDVDTSSSKDSSSSSKDSTIVAGESTSGTTTAPTPARPGESVIFTSTGDPTEIALNVLSYKAKDKKKVDLEQTHFGRMVADFPFDSTIKRMTVVYEKTSSRNEQDGTTTYYVLTKGAPEGVMSLCAEIVGTHSGITSPTALKHEGAIPLTLEHEEQIRTMNESMADKGLRVLCFAYKTVVGPYDQVPEELLVREQAENDLDFVGLVGIQDPPRAEVPHSIKVAEEAGIIVHMVTGDHPSTARAIARQIGIIKPSDPDDVVMKATQFDALSDEELKNMERLPLVIARCSPQTKVKMVKALHARKRLVAMTGDGVNDAPAIKQADIGISMGKAGSDVTKEASDIILTDDDFGTIVEAIREGRRIFANIRKFVIHLLSANVAQLIALMIPQLMGHSSPLNPTQILWLNLITGTPPAVSLGTEHASKNIMNKNKRPVNESLFNFETIVDIIFYGALMAAIMLMSFFMMGELWLYKDERESMGVAFTTVTMMLLFHAYNCRHPRRSFYFDQFIKSWLLHLSILVGIALQCFILYVPWINSVIFEQTGLGWEAWVIVLVGVAVFMASVEVYKAIKRVIVATYRRIRGIKKKPKKEVELKNVRISVTA